MYSPGKPHLCTDRCTDHCTDSGALQRADYDADPRAASNRLRRFRARDAGGVAGGARGRARVPGRAQGCSCLSRVGGHFCAFNFAILTKKAGGASLLFSFFFLGFLFSRVFLRFHRDTSSSF